MAAVSMSKQEFGRLEVLLGVQSGRLRVAVMPYCARRVRRRRGVISTLRTRCHFYLAPTSIVIRGLVALSREDMKQPSNVPVDTIRLFRRVKSKAHYR